MTWAVSIGGKTFTHADVDGNAYADEATGFPAILAAIAQEGAFLKGSGATSTTSITPSIGSVDFTLDQSPNWSIGSLLKAASASAPDHYLIGTVVSLDGANLSMLATITAGGAAKSDWVITYPIPGHFNVSEDVAPQLGGDLDAAGFGISMGGGDLDLDGGNLSNLRLATGSASRLTDLGTVTTGTVTIDWDSTDYTKITLGGDVTIDVTEPPADFVHVKTLWIVQDATGGREITWHRAGTTTGILHQGGDPVPFGLQAATVVSRVVVQFIDGLLWIGVDENLTGV